MRFWILTGNLVNWERGIADSIWGVKPSLKKEWDGLSPGDLLIFYVTYPVMGVIGVGRVENKREEKTPLWADEIKEKKVIYPYRFNFKVEYVLPKPSWMEGKISLKDLNIGYPWIVRSGLNPVADPKSVELILEKLDLSWNTNFRKYITASVPVEGKKKLSSHDEIQEKLLEIGRIERFISEKEFPVDGERLDVVWRSPNVTGAVPKYVFEIQVGGDILHALGKLKHANDKWNSYIFLVASEKDLPKIDSLLSGTFHEIRIPSE
ncbi:MAG: hypothetical protein QXG98_02395 [Candidatus Micrarchaeia archaeon]